LSVEAFLKLYETSRDRYGWVDVRSESEFDKAALPGFNNLPILTDSERHQVGLTYKQKGQAEAVRLGHALVDPQRPERVANWKKIIDTSPTHEGVVICWRGGMRSQIASDWMRQAGASVSTVEGGFKAIRNELLKSLTQLPEFTILSGLTGSGKTELLKRLETPKIDLEGLANHRGSSFGRKILEKQPNQATFENLLCLDLRKNGGAPIMLEDESVSIGHCFLPRDFKLKMNGSHCVWVESPMEERAQRIYEEYVREPLDQGIASKTVFEWMLASLERITRKLGGLETGKTHRLLEEAFRRSDETGFRPSHHEEWISQLLKLYYDPMYLYGFNKNVTGGRKIVFRGTSQECQQWMKSGLPKQ
jgi:tRNA 2-selenouridine synthase